MVSDAEPTGPDALLHRYVDGDLSPEERTALEARIARILANPLGPA